MWRAPTEIEQRPVLSLDVALERVGQKKSSDTVRFTTSRLGYYSAPSFSGQQQLFPVYAVNTEFYDGKDWLPGRIQLVPATDIGEVYPAETPIEQRSVTREKLPQKLPNLRDIVRPGHVVPADLNVSSVALRNAGVKPADVLTRTPNGQIFLKPNLTSAQLRAIFEALRPRSFGASWIGSLGGLAGSQGNVQGFIDGLQAEGWRQRFNWGNGNAWKSDWIANDDQYVDDVDIVYYTGHASPTGWQLADGSVHHSEVGATPNSPSDHWGQNNLEWMVIAACGPLQDDIANGGGRAFDRWRGAFDGLHLLLGYSAVSYDNTEEGRRFVRYARQGMTLRQAWFRAAQETQPATNGYKSPNGPKIYASAMYTWNDVGSTYNDHLWGHGSVGPDVRSGAGGGHARRGLQVVPC